MPDSVCSKCGKPADDIPANQTRMPLCRYCWIFLQPSDWLRFVYQGLEALKGAQHDGHPSIPTPDGHDAG